MRLENKWDILIMCSAITIWTCWWCLFILWHMNILRSYSLPKKLEPRVWSGQIDRSRRLKLESLVLLFAWLFVLHWWSNIKRSDYLTRSQDVSDVSNFGIFLRLLIQLDFFSGFEAPDHSQRHIELPEKSRMQSLSYSHIPRGQQGPVLVT